MVSLTSTGQKNPQPVLDEGWTYEEVPVLNRGVNVSVRSELIKSSELREALNVRMDQARIIKDYGFKDFASKVRGTPRVDFQFFKKDGSSQLTLITNLSFYTWSSTVDQWQYVANGTSTTLSGNEAAGQTVLSVTSETGFSVSDNIGILLNDGMQHQTTVASTAAGEITVDDPLPSAADSGNSVVNSVVLSGNDDKGVSITTWALSDKMYFANGEDTPKQFDGTNVTDISNLPGTTFICYLVAVYNNYLVLMRTEEDGTAFPQRVRWCEPGDPTDWNESVNFRDLYESEDFIVASEKLGPFQIIYKERSIVRMEFVGTVDITFRFEDMISGEGAVSVDSVINLDSEHILFGNSNIYKYKGGFDTEAIGDNVYDKLFGQNGELNPGFVSRVFAVYVEETDEALFFYPNSPSENPNRLARLKLSTGAWSFRDYADDITGFGFFRTQGDIIWQNAVGKWTDYEFPWNAKQIQDNSPTLHLCAIKTRDTVSVLDSTSNNYDGNTIGEVEISLQGGLLNSVAADFGSEDNVTDGIKLPGASLDTLTDFTIEGWLEPTENGNIFVSAANASASNEIFLQIGEVPSTTIRVGIKGTLINWTSSDGVPSVLAQARRYSFTRDGTTGDVELFIDGTSMGTKNFPTGALSVDDNGLFLGQEQDSLSGSFDATQKWRGLMDDVRFWNDIRTQTEINDNKALELVGNETGLVAYYKFGEGTVTDNLVYEVDYIVTDDDGITIPYEIQTKDFYVPSKILRFDRHDFILSGTGVLIEYSIDGGNTFDTLGIVSPGPQHMLVSLYKQFTGRSVRYKLTGNQDIQLEALGFTYKEESNY
jgi:hypothetical protein